MIKYASHDCHLHLLNAYNKILRDVQIDDQWYDTIFRMLPKSGDLKDPGNWRPIAILPILYKIFSKMLYNRLLPFLDRAQCDDQIGFRPGIRIENAFAILNGLVDIAKKII